ELAVESRQDCLGCRGALELGNCWIVFRGLVVEAAGREGRTEDFPVPEVAQVVRGLTPIGGAGFWVGKHFHHPFVQRQVTELLPISAQLARQSLGIDWPALR